MSAFLGPIHHWLYNKILLQEDFTDAVLKLAEEKGWAPGLRGNCEDICGTVERGDLSDIIDETRIHPWLQERVDTAEQRWNYTVTAVLAEDPSRLGELETLMKGLGAADAGRRGETPSEAYREITNHLLDGMPCDQALSAAEADDGSVQVATNRNIHERYWPKYGPGIAVYNGLRAAWLDGFFQSSGIALKRTGEDSFLLEKR